MDEAGILGGYETGGKTSFLDAASGVIHTLNTSGVYMRKDLAGNILFQRDLGGLLEKDYVLPTEFQVYDGVFYAPGRRFAVRDGAGEKTFLVSDEPQASAVTADGVYTANYTDCTLYFYPFETFAGDPEAVWMNDPERFLLADIENQCRPSQMEPTPDGKYLVIGSGPMYGRFGGAVSVYDLERRALLYTHENVVEGHQIQSVKCSAARPGCVWLGTNPYGENTTPQYLDEPSHLILWDIRGERALLDLVPDEDSQKLGSIAELDGRVFCVTQAAHLLSFDAESGEALSANRKDGVREVLAVSDGRLLGVNDGALFSIDPETLRTRTLAKGFRFLHHLTEDPVTGELYVFDYAELARLTPGEGP